MWYTHMHTSHGTRSPFPGITGNLCRLPVPLGAKSSLTLSVLLWKVCLTSAVQSHALPQRSFLFTMFLPRTDGLWSSHTGLPFLLLEWKACIHICVYTDTTASLLAVGRGFGKEQWEVIEEVMLQLPPFSVCCRRDWGGGGLWASVLSSCLSVAFMGSLLCCSVLLLVRTGNGCLALFYMLL